MHKSNNLVFHKCYGIPQVMPDRSHKISDRLFFVSLILFAYLVKIIEFSYLIFIFYHS